MLICPLIRISGLKFYGSPWQPEFCDWAFNLPYGGPLKEKWERIPDDTGERENVAAEARTSYVTTPRVHCVNELVYTDVLITHGPPHLFGDWTEFGGRVGCPELANEIKTRIRPKVHVFGHIHEVGGA